MCQQVYEYMLVVGGGMVEERDIGFKVLNNMVFDFVCLC